MAESGASLFLQGARGQVIQVPEPSLSGAGVVHGVPAARGVAIPTFVQGAFLPEVGSGPRAPVGIPKTTTLRPAA